jgi:hypothetical protein
MVIVYWWVWGPHLQERRAHRRVAGPTPGGPTCHSSLPSEEWGADGDQAKDSLDGNDEA